MAFDVDAFREAHRPWAFTYRGRAFPARHVSALLVLEYEDRVRRAAAVGKTNAGRGARLHLAALHILLRHAYPWRPTYLIRGDPVKIILGLEPAARAEALKDFFACLQGKPAIHLNGHTTPKTPGTRWPERIPPQRH